MPITTGQFFANILVAITPTALGRALEHQPTNIAAWSKALTDDIQNRVTTETALVVSTLQDLLVEYPQIFDALLTPVYLPDGQGGYAPVPVALVMKREINALGLTQGLLNEPWDNPPHPPGQSVLNLINTVGAYDEQ